MERLWDLSGHIADVVACFWRQNWPSETDETDSVALVIVVLRIVERGGLLCCSSRDGCAAERR